MRLPLFGLADGQVVGPGDFRGGGGALDDLRDDLGLPPCRPSFDVLWFLAHGNGGA